MGILTGTDKLPATAIVDKGYRGVKLGRNPLKRALGDALHAVMCGAGHNLRLILAALRLLRARFGLSIRADIAALLALPGDHRPVCC